jgi:hypothetical protein
MIAHDEPAAAGSVGPTPPFHAELRVLYAELDAAVARLSPVCAISGRCCRFREYGHTLFLSHVEAEYLVGEAPRPARALDDGATCPWQDDRGRCTAREARPLGCRVFFCDPAFEDAAPALSERFIARLKAIADRHRLPWDYAPLHRHLHGRFGPGHGEDFPGPVDPS